jgi:EGF-like domain
MTDGTANIVIQNFAIHVATIMVSVRMERVCASPAGMESIAHSKAVREGKTLRNSCQLNIQLAKSFSSCSGHGQCRVGGEGFFECRCNDGWDGSDCSLPLEKDCKDGKDNDKGRLGVYIRCSEKGIN